MRGCGRRSGGRGLVTRLPYLGSRVREWREESEYAEVWQEEWWAGTGSRGGKTADQTAPGNT